MVFPKVTFTVNLTPHNSQLNAILKGVAEIAL